MHLLGFGAKPRKTTLSSKMKKELARENYNRTKKPALIFQGKLMQHPSDLDCKDKIKHFDLRALIY